jgi:prepilin-type processing-associated H-X9-DG protein
MHHPTHTEISKHDSKEKRNFSRIQGFTALAPAGISRWAGFAGPAGNGFTRVELLVVLATVAILLLTLLSALAGTRDKSQRARCVNNLHQSWIAIQAFADENDDYLPRQIGAFSGSRLWNLPLELSDTLTDAGARRSIMYCPSGPAPDLEAFWNVFSVRHTGYYWLFKRYSAQGNPYLTFVPPAELLEKITEPLPGRTVAETELVTDVTISATEGRLSDTFTSVVSTHGGFPYYSSSHLQGRLPAGGNILFMDGHVAWRPFDQMQPRAASNSREHYWY